jgi:hypothetical protein
MLAGNEVWAEPLSINRQQGVIMLLFSTSPHAARDAVTLSRWSGYALFLAQGWLPCRTPLEQALYRWTTEPSLVGQIVPLARQGEAGIDLWGAAVRFDLQVVGQAYNENDHNGSILWLGFQGQMPVILGPVGENVVAMQRLASLYQQGGRPVVAARVQANGRLLEPGQGGDPGLIVYSFDPTVQTQELEQLALTIYDLKMADEKDVLPALQGTRNAILANEDCWFYHRRYQVAPEMTAGRQVWLADLYFHRPFLAGGYLSENYPRLMPVLAKAHQPAGVELIPFHQIGQFWPGERAGMFALR